MSEVKVNKISPRSGTALTVGDSGDTVTVTGNDIRSDSYKASDGGNLVSQSGTTITLGASGDTVSIASGATLVGGGIDWQSAVKTANFTAVAGEGYFVNTSGGAFEIDLPTSPSVGDEIEFVDFSRSFGTNNLTLDQGSNKFQSVVASTKKAVLSTDGQNIKIVYSGSTQGWIPTTDDDVEFLTTPSYSVDFLTVAGGAGGGRPVGGGGGAGGYRNSFGSEVSGGGNSSETSLTFSPGTVYTITVGAGGAGTAQGGPAAAGASGASSSISGTGITTITSAGGGGGGAENVAAVVGGCGGGGGKNGDGVAGTTNQGFAGGDGADGGGQQGGGGGGGSDTNGINGTASKGGNGGSGNTSSITGSAVARAGGGGGSGCDNLTEGTGGTGGGGDGNTGSNDQGSSGTANTGGGGGGAHDVAAGNGGSGVVILSMPDASYSGTTTGSPNVATGVSGKTVLTFTGDGSYTG
jgi:hypothetical protein